MKRDVRNGEIEFWRGVFCLIVFVFHLSLDSESTRTLFPKGQIGVEFFFVLSGLFMAKAADVRRQTDTDRLGQESMKYVFHKYASIFPYHLVVFVAAFIRMMVNNHFTVPEGIERFLLTLPQFLLIHLAGLHEAKVVSVEWYLSAMLIGMLFMYPLLRKFYDRYVFIVGPLLSFSILGYMYKNVGHLLRKYEWVGVTTGGVLRAVAIMNLGCFAYEMAKMIQRRNWNRKGYFLLSLICLGGYGSTIYFAMTGMDEKVRFTLVFLLMVSVAITFSGKNLYGTYMNHDIFRFIGKISLPFYLNTNLVRNFMKYMDFNQLRYRYFVVIGILVNILLSSLLVVIVDKIRKINEERSAVLTIT